MRRGDKIIYTAIATLFVAFVLFRLLFGAPDRTGGTDENPLSGMTLEITVDGKTTREIPLSGISGEITVELPEGGGLNTLRIDRHGVAMISSDCPGGDCLRTNPLVSEREIIVCMPRKLVIRLKRTKTTPAKREDFDAVTY